MNMSIRKTILYNNIKIRIFLSNEFPKNNLKKFEHSFKRNEENYCINSKVKTLK